MRPFVDFYRDNQISPVAQDISDLEKHFSRRDALYRQLGLPAHLLAGKNVLEFGPGGGHNSLFTAHCRPARYLLVDGNPVGVKELRQRLQPAADAGMNLEVRESYFEDFNSDERFSVVLAEGFLPWQRDPAALARHLGRFVEPHGLFVITTSDPVSSLSEILRRLMGAILSDPSRTVVEQVQALVPVFKPHLESLGGMSRPHQDWILDNIIHPVVGKWFSVPDAVGALAEEFDFYGSAPHFLQDWRWYKDLHGTDRNYNRRAIQSYQELVHNFINFREQYPPRASADNEELVRLCYQVWDLECAYRDKRSLQQIQEVSRVVREIAELTHEFSGATADALKEFSLAAEEFTNSGNFPELRFFPSLFGRGQQYLSFIRRANFI